MTDPHDNLRSLIRTARQAIDTERFLAGDVMPSRPGGLPETHGGLAPDGPVEPVGLGTGEPTAATREEKAALLAALDQEVKACTHYGLHVSRTQTVFADGDPGARLMFVGEGPGADEDIQGLPFVGRAGKLLDRMIEAMGLTRAQVYIGNVVKCRPPGNRTPSPEEAAACWGYLQRQIEILQPEVIVVLGNAAAKALLDTRVGITKLRGTWQQLWDIPVMPTFHPAYLLRQYTQDNRRRVWSDLQAVMVKLGLATP